MIRIVVDDVPPSLNRFAGRQNAWEYRKLKERWTKAVMLKGLSVRPDKPFEKSVVTLEYRFPDKRRRDPDNYSGKLILDGLTKSGIIADDSFSQIALTIKSDANCGKKRTVITVEEVIK